MGNLTRAAVVLAFVGASLSAGIIPFATTAVGTTGGGDIIYRISYDLSGVQLLENQELDFRFDPLIYSTLFNPVAPAVSFDPVVFQPNNPPGAAGDFSVLALTNNPPTTGPFSVDLTLLAGQSGVPTSQPYFINQLTANGAFVAMVDSGTAVNPTPEPMSLLTVAVGLAGLGFIRNAKRRAR